MMLGTSVHQVPPKYLRMFNLLNPVPKGQASLTLLNLVSKGQASLASTNCYTFSFSVLKCWHRFKTNYPIFCSLYHNDLSNFHLIFKSFKVIDGIHLKNNFIFSFCASFNTSVIGKQIWKRTQANEFPTSVATLQTYMPWAS